MTASSVRRVSIVLFDGFELLDVFGPLELLSIEPERIEVELVGPRAGSVASSQGAEVVAPIAYAEAGAPDIVLVPGGAGTRRLVHDAAFLDWLRSWSLDAALVTSVCTGSAVLAAAGLLEGRRATSNKLAFAWAAGHGGDVDWAPSARWVEDGDRWTSSGVAAGMDMTAALMDRILGDGAGTRAAAVAELELHLDADRDPFARSSGLIS